MSDLVLSLFPGIGLLDMAFEEQGFCVVRNKVSGHWEAMNVDRCGIIKVAAECWLHPTANTGNLFMAGCGNVILPHVSSPASMSHGGLLMPSDRACKVCGTPLKFWQLYYCSHACQGIDKRQPRHDAKRCSRCQQIKPLSEFSISRSKSDGYSAYCKPCMAEYRREHSESIRESGQRWRERDPDHARDLGRERDAKYRKNNPDEAKAKGQRYRESHPEREQERWRRYRQENPDAIKAKKHRRETRKRGNGGSFSAAEWQALKAYYGYHCLCCGKTEEQIIAEQGYGLTPDHVIPIAKGGSNDIGNIQPLCKRCNSRKNDKATDYRGRW